MKITALNCPNCGAPFTPPESKNYCFCGNCGTKMFVDNGDIFVNMNINTTTRSIDEAKIVKEKQKTRRTIIIVIATPFILFLLFMFIGLLTH